MELPRQSDFVADDEPLARFVLHNKYVRADGTVKPEAFLESTGELSVTRTRALAQEAVWRVGRDIALKRALPPKVPRGFARVITGHVRSVVHHDVALDVRPDPPPPEHAVIINWPEDTKVRRSLALRIAQIAQWQPVPGEVVNNDDDASVPVSATPGAP